MKRNKTIEQAQIEALVRALPKQGVPTFAGELAQGQAYHWNSLQPHMQIGKNWEHRPMVAYGNTIDALKKFQQFLEMTETCSFWP